MRKIEPPLMILPLGEPAVGPPVATGPATGTCGAGEGLPASRVEMEKTTRRDNKARIGINSKDSFYNNTILQ
jgi:hypothetical protein